MRIRSSPADWEVSALAIILLIGGLWRLLLLLYFREVNPIADTALLESRISPVTDLTLFLQAAPFSSRGLELHEYYRSFTFPPRLSLQYFFVGLLARNATEPPNIAMPNEYLQWQSYPLHDGESWPIRETAKYFFIFNYALEHTTARWIYRGFDDVSINFDRLLDYLWTLERRWDPLVDVVVRGDCIANGLLYPNGGPGTLFSRAAVRRFAPLGNFTVWETKEEYDDQRFGRTLLKAKINVAQTASSAFLGFVLDDEEPRGLSTHNYTDLVVTDPCPKASDVMQSGCKIFIAPLNDVIFLHKRTQTFSERLETAKGVWDAPPWLHFHHDGCFGTLLCRYTRPKLYEGNFAVP